MKILIAEDDLVLRRLLKKSLEEWGHDPIIAKDGNEAWETLLRENIKFVIADWLMPGMDGIDLCKKIRESGRSDYVYFIILTSRDRKEDVIAGLEAGADDFVTKPFDRDELRVRLRAGERILNLERELTEKNDKLEELVSIDPLTGIGNRRSFYDTMWKVHDRARRYGQGYGVIMCDVDYFKAYNDTYGHLWGDQILISVARSIKRSCRGSDEIFRYGGEEMVVILPGQDIDSTALVAGRIRAGIESLDIEHKGSKTGILTASCGAASFIGSDDKWEAVLDRADKALYVAKGRGRNSICSSVERPEAESGFSI